MNPRDLLRELQAAARAAAEHFTAQPARRLVLYGEGGARLLDIAVPLCPCAEGPPHVAPGWAVTEHGARFDGAPVTVSPSRLKLLRALVEADGPRTAKELAEQAFDAVTTIDNVRYHLRELRKELKKAFTFDGDVIQGDDDGYLLGLR